MRDALVAVNWHLSAAHNLLFENMTGARDMEQATRRLELLAGHLGPVGGDSLLVNSASAVPSADSATIALPEKLCDDPLWRVHRC